MTEGWDPFVESFLEEHLAAHPDLAVSVGRHEFDGQLPDWSPEGLDAEVRRLRDARRRAEAFSPEELDDRSAFERDYLLAVLDREIFWRDRASWPQRNPLFYGPALSPQVYLSREYAPLRQRLEAFISYARRVPRAAACIRQNLTPPLPATYVDVGRTLFGGLAEYFREQALAAFEEVDDPRLQRQAAEALEEACEALDELDGWLGEQAQGATEEFALGEEGLSEMLWATERVDVPLGRLEEVARSDLDHNLRRLQAACRRVDPDLEMDACVAKIQAQKPDPTPVDVARRQVAELRERIEREQLVSIPENAETRVAEAPPFLRWNAAHIEIPGAFEGDLPAVYYLATPDPEWSEEEREAYVPCVSDLYFISAHEVWPGHYLQFLHAHAAASRVARVFVTYSFAEGWAHYAEEMSWERGVGEASPELEVGLRLNALLRDVRFLAAIRLHTSEMTVEEAEALFADDAFQDTASARQQAARGTFDPGYLSYTMGKLMITKLREDWLEAHPEGTWRAFHDRLLSYGSPPVPLVRDALLDGSDGSLF